MLRRLHEFARAKPERAALLYAAICALLAVSFVMLRHKSELVELLALVFQPAVPFFDKIVSPLPQGWVMLIELQLFFSYFFVALLPAVLAVWKYKWHFLALQAIVLAALWSVGAVLFLREHKKLPSLSARINLRLLVICNVEITEGNFSGSNLTDADLVWVAKLENLSQLNLGGTKMSDKGLTHLKLLTKLQSLMLSRTEVSDVGMEHLKSLTQLRMLFINNTKVSCEGIEGLKKSLPNCVVYIWDPF